MAADKLRSLALIPSTTSTSVLGLLIIHSAPQDAGVAIEALSHRCSSPDYSYTQFDLEERQTLPRRVNAWSARKDGLHGIIHLSLTLTCFCRIGSEFRPEFFRVDSAGVILELVIGEAIELGRRKPNAEGSPGEQDHRDLFRACLAIVVLIAHAILAALVLRTNCLLRKKRARFKGYAPGCRGSGGVMPWSIPVALAVLWGVCWMFRPSPAGDRLDPAIDPDFLDFTLFDSSEFPQWDPTLLSLPANNHDSPQVLDFSTPVMLGNFPWEGCPMPLGAQETEVPPQSAPSLSIFPAGSTGMPDGDWNSGMTQAAPDGTVQLGASGQVHASPRSASHHFRVAGTTAAEPASADIAYEELQDREKGVSAQSRQQDTVAASGSMPGFTCPTCDKPFPSRKSLTAHEKTVHGNKGAFLCPVLGCKRNIRGWPRRDNRDRHVQALHGHLSRTGSQTLSHSPGENNNQATTQQPAVERLDAASQPSRIDVSFQSMEEVLRELRMERELRARAERQVEEFKALHERMEKRADQRERMHEEREKRWGKLWEERERMYEKCLKK